MKDSSLDGLLDDGVGTGPQHELQAAGLPMGVSYGGGGALLEDELPIPVVLTTVLETVLDPLTVDPIVDALTLAQSAQITANSTPSLATIKSVPIGTDK